MLHQLSLVPSYILALVFCVSGVMKLLNPDASRISVGDFGVPRQMARPVGLLLPLVELALVFLVLFPPLAPVGSILALIVLGTFSGAIGFNLMRGRRPSCNCFGALSNEPIGPTTLLRNAAFIVIALLAVIAAWHHNLTMTRDVVYITALAVLVLLGAAEGVYILWLRRNPGDVPDHQRLQPGDAASDFAASGLDGVERDLTDLRSAGRPVMLLFVSATCEPCNAIAPDVAAWQRTYQDWITIAVMAQGDQAAMAEKAREFGLRNVLVDEGASIADRYAVLGTPSAIIVRPDGRIGSPVASGPLAIHGLLAEVLSLSAISLPSSVLPASPELSAMGLVAPLAVGTPLPRAIVRDAQGFPVVLRSVPGKKTLFLFWDPTCEFCERAQEDFRQWYRGAGREEVELVVVLNRDGSFAPAPEVAAYVDPEFEVTTRWGIGGTPMALAVDESGVVMSTVAIGAPRILALAERLTRQNTGSAA